MIRRIPAFDAVSTKRLVILKSLLNRELDNGEVSTLTGMSRKTVYWHLNILTDVGLIKSKKYQKLNLSPNSKRKTRDIFRMSLTLDGIEAIKYFGGD